jgi:glucose/arabinose dehydrogenase
MIPRTRLALAAAALVLTGCGGKTERPASAGYGPQPVLPAPTPQKGVPTLNPATYVGWPKGAAPVAPAGFTVARYAEGLKHPRNLYRLPNGDVLVAESNSGAHPNEGFQGWVAERMRQRGGVGVPSANRVTLLRDADGDGRAELRTVFLEGLNAPYGMALVGDQLYVASTDALWRFAYRPGQTRIAAPAVKVCDLPHNAPNNHWVKNIAVSPDGTKIYVGIGSNSNIADGPGGIAGERERANVLVMNLDGSGRRVFASGLRNPVGLAWEPQSGVLWATVNERDMLGHDLVPDYMTGLRDGGFYGWPYSYYGAHLDPRVTPQRPDLVATARKPDFALGAHTASLGISFYGGAALPAHYRGGAFVAQHGSWNRNPRSGYKVVFIPFANGRPSGPAEDFLTGFLSRKGDAYGRPAGVATDTTGALLVADDAGDKIWRVAAR